MPAAFSGRLRGRLLLLLLCISLSGGSPADPAVTTQDSSQTQADFLTKMQVGLNESSGPDVTTQDLKPAGKENPSNVSVYEIVLSGVSGRPLERNISVASPTKVELSCKLDKNSPMKNPQVTWKKGSDTISHTTKSENSWSIQLTILDSSQLGSYSCILKGKQEISAVFHLQVPKIEGKDKPIITYEGDAAVMVCKTDYIPIAWTWYMTNGSKQVAINDSMPAKKYVINRQSANATRLKVLQLTKEDGGLYWCEATFQLGKSKGKLELKVLSIMAPLKPFVAIVAEVVIFVTTIFLYEWYSKKKEKRSGGEREFDQIERLKSEELRGKQRSSRLRRI